MAKSILFNEKEKRRVKHTFLTKKEKHASTPLNITSLKFITVHFYHMVPIQKKKLSHRQNLRVLNTNVLFSYKYNY